MIKAQLVKTQKTPSKYGGDFFYLFFKGEDGKSYRSCVVSTYRNWKNWRDIVENFSEDSPIWLDGLSLKNGMVDADSNPRIIKDYEQ